MAITLEIGVGNLLPELLANALILLCALQAARAITAGALQAFFDPLDHFLVLIEPYSHGFTSLPRYYNRIVNHWH